MILSLLFIYNFFIHDDILICFGFVRLYRCISKYHILMPQRPYPIRQIHTPSRTLSDACMQK